MGAGAGTGTGTSTRGPSAAAAFNPDGRGRPRTACREALPSVRAVWGTRPPAAATLALRTGERSVRCRNHVTRTPINQGAATGALAVGQAAFISR